MKTRIVTLMLSEEDYNLILPYIDIIPLLVKTVDKLIAFYEWARGKKIRLLMVEGSEKQRAELKQKAELKIIEGGKRSKSKIKRDTHRAVRLLKK